MHAKLTGAAALLAAGILASADSAFAMARPVTSAPEIDGAAGIAVMGLLAGLAAILANRNRG